MVRPDNCRIDHLQRGIACAASGERFFNRLKNSRRVATRYDKLIESFAAFVILATIRIWIRFVHTT